jgi:hypothetical protein
VEKAKKSLRFSGARLETIMGKVVWLFGNQFNCIELAERDHEVEAENLTQQ